MLKNSNTARHTLFNLVGLGAPLVVAVITIPLLIHALGPNRFGLLTLIWAVVSYFGLFDLGLGRALTQHLALALSGDTNEQVGPLVFTSTVLMAVLGLFSGILLSALAPWGVGLIKADANSHESLNAIYAMSVAMPFIILTSGFRGILEARHAFGIINLIRLPMGLFTFLGPLAVVLYGDARLDSISWVLVGGRVLACFVHGCYAWKTLPKTSGPLIFERQLVKPLCISGGWLSVSNIISPFMGYVDRFVIGATISGAAVAYYTTPLELVTKLWIIPGAFLAVLFPIFAVQMAKPDTIVWISFKKAILWLFALLLPITVALMLFSKEILSIWIGPNFAAQSAPILQIFAVGIFINCLAQVPFTLIQSAGAARLTAIIHCVELPLFLVLLWILTTRHGLKGAALAWLIRIIVDTILMFSVCTPLLGRPVYKTVNARVLKLVLCAGISFSGILLNSIYARGMWLLGVAVLAVGLILISILNERKLQHA